jgi:peptidyl-prolyl cis-trans isomerase C
VHCHDGKTTQDIFASDAKALSNCPSGAEGGDVGWLTSADDAPEFPKALFGSHEVGVLPRLVRSCFGSHAMEIMARQAGLPQTFESVPGAVAMTLRQTTDVTALRQYLSVLSGAADFQGIDPDTAGSPLLQ